MNDPIDIIQTILIVTLMVVLAAILYKKLLKKLGNDPSKPRFLNLENSCYDKGRGVLVLNMDAPAPTEIEVFISGPGKDRKQIVKMSLEVGKHAEEMPVGTLSSGKFEIEVQTEKQKISSFLVVD